MAYEKNKNENYDNRGGINDKASKYLTQQGQFLDLRNYAFDRVGDLVSRPGISEYASFPIGTYLAGPYNTVQYRKDNGFSQIVFDSGCTLFAFNGSAIGVAGSLSANATTGYPIDFEIGNNVLYFANGYTFQRYDGSYSCRYNIPAQRVYMLGAGITFNTSLSALGATAVLPAGMYSFKYAYKRGTAAVDGIVGERTADDVDVGIGVPFLTVSLSATLVVTQGNWLVYGITVTNGFGISSIVPYLDYPSAGTDYLAGPTAAAFFATTYSGITLYSLQFEPFSTSVDYQNQYNFTLVPSILSVYKNMLFMSGFSSVPSTVYFSEIGEYERTEPENFFDVRTGNADKITCSIVFQDTLIYFKNRSVHSVSGDSPETLSLKDMTLAYGCVNNTAAVVWENKLWFMDSRGICEYNGPDTSIVSYAIEDKLRTVDKTKCRAIYVKKRNEVWFCCGSVCFVYDHDINAWTVFDNIPIEFTKAAHILEFTDGTIDLAYFSYGSSYLSLNRFGDSTFTDFGAGITLMFKSKFHIRDTQTTQEMWRRLYFNSNVPSVTTSATLLFYQDYGTSVVHSDNIFLNQFQTRIDFGISARALQVECIISATEQVRVNGYTIESRYLRSV